MVSFDSNPQPIRRNMSAQVHTGEYRPNGMGAKGNIYVQNNFYGPQHPRGWSGDAWANMDNCCNHDDSNNTLGEISGWTGVVAAGVGSFLDLLGVGKKDKQEVQQEGEPAKNTPDPGNPAGKSKDDTTTNPADKKDDTTTNPADKKDDATVQSTQRERVEQEETSWPDGEFETEVTDASGKTDPIKGKTKVTQKADKGSKFPKEFTITTAQGFTYTFKFDKTGDNGKAIYKCVSETNNKGQTRNINSGNSYECDMSSGKPKFEQSQELDPDGFGKGV